MLEEDRFSLERVINEFGNITKKLKNFQTSVRILERGMRGDGREDYYFTGESIFFKKFYPEFEDLYKRIRERGIQKGYIKE